MTAQIRFLLARLTANYWFYPSVFSIAAGLIGLAMVALDRAGFADDLVASGWILSVGPAEASDILTLMAGSMIAVASTVFSITIVAVTHASATYGPRLLTNFLEDRGNQISLAVFIASFVYALIVLRAVRAPSGEMQGFAPQLSLVFAYIMMAVCVGVLVFFLNHVPASIRINKVLEQIGERLIASIKKTYPIEDSSSDARAAKGGQTVRARETGYLQLIDFENLEQKAREHGVTVSLRVRTGDFVHRDLPLLDLDGDNADRMAREMDDYFTLGPVRTPEQDPQFLIDELVEIGLRALSPGINDPFTAITAIHWLGAATAEIARRDLRKDICKSDAESCPIIPRPDDFAHYIDRGFGSMRSAVASSPIAARITFKAMSNAAYPTDDERRCDLLLDEGLKLAKQARLALDGPDRDLVDESYHEFKKSFDD